MPPEVSSRGHAGLGRSRQSVTASLSSHGPGVNSRLTPSSPHPQSYVGWAASLPHLPWQPLFLLHSGQHRRGSQIKGSAQSGGCRNLTFLGGRHTSQQQHLSPRASGAYVGVRVGVCCPEDRSMCPPELLAHKAGIRE